MFLKIVLLISLATAASAQTSMQLAGISLLLNQLLQTVNNVVVLLLGPVGNILTGNSNTILAGNLVPNVQNSINGNPSTGGVNAVLGNLLGNVLGPVLGGPTGNALGLAANGNLIGGLLNGLATNSIGGLLSSLLGGLSGNVLNLGLGANVLNPVIGSG